MKIAYLDCISGISGDMILGAFLDAGFKLSVLKDALSKLDLTGYKIMTKKVKRHHISAIKLDIDIEKDNCKFTPGKIEKIIKESRLENDIKQTALKIFKNLCMAEKKVHKISNGVHLHELGNADTILDIVGVSVCIKMWNIQKLYFSKLIFGRGIQVADSGMLPIPAPVSLELLKNIPSKFSDIDSELITPTGAAILSTLGTFCREPEIKVKNLGYGAGSRDLKQLPNALRLLVGEEVPSYLSDNVTVLESAIDDTMPIVYTYLYDELFKLGALDVYITNIQMKKNRPGQLLTVVLPNHLLSDIAEFIFRETNTTGLRYYRPDRLKLHRVSRKVRTRYGRISVKISGSEKESYKSSPEFESCKKIAMNKKIPFARVYEEAKKAIILSVFFVFVSFAPSFCDTIYLNDGSQVKGIIVEEYSDRVVISTEYGEAEMMKGEIKGIDYDLMEQNLLSLGNKYKEAGDYVRAYFYYDKARKLNPQYKEAVDGANYLQGFLFRKEMGRKADEVNRYQDLEDFQQNRFKKEEQSMSNLKQLIGIEIQDTGKNIKVIKVYKGLPADKAGIKKGDYLAAIWGKLTGYMSSEEVAQILSKPENLELKLEIDRKIKVSPRAIKSSQFDLRFEGLCLRNISDRSEAFASGLRNNDLILSIDGASIRYTPLKEAMDSLRSGPGTLLIRRELTIWRRK